MSGPFVRFAAAASIVLLSHAPLALAQGPKADGRLLRESVDTFNVSFAGDVFGRGIIARARVATSNGQQLLQVYSWRIAGGVIVDSLFSDVASLQSLRQVRVVGDSVIEIVYRGDSAHVAKRAYADTPRRESFALEPGVYSSAAIDQIVAGLPLDEEFDAQLRFYYAPPSERGVELINVRVLGSEPVRDRFGSQRDAWVVATGTPAGGTVYWVDKATRSVLQFDTREGRALLEFRRAGW